LNLFLDCDHSDIFRIPQVSQLFFDKIHFKKLHNQRISLDFDIILEKLPEGVVLTDHEGTIITINKSAQEILKINSNHLMNIPSLFASEQFQGTSQSIMEDSIDSIQAVFQEKLPCPSQKRYLINIYYFYSMAILHLLIAKEIVMKKEKTNKYKKMILPQYFIEASNSIEAFMIPFASVMFLRIIKFSCWRKKQTDQMIMSTLNSCVNLLDDLLKKILTLIRVNRIGFKYVVLIEFSRNKINQSFMLKNVFNLD
jgi:hypothetical protein